jgi:secreted PhoX family phosphatase
MSPDEPVDPQDPAEPSEPQESTSDMEIAQRETSAMGRRRFMHVLAVGGAAVLAGGVPNARAASPKPESHKAAAPKGAKPVSPAMQKELRSQEKNLADVLKVVRDYDLPPGSEPATVFRAMRARRGMR